MKRPTKAELTASVEEAKKRWPSAFKPGEEMYPKILPEDVKELNQEFRRIDAFLARCVSQAKHTPKKSFHP